MGPAGRSKTYISTAATTNIVTAARNPDVIRRPSKLFGGRDTTRILCSIKAVLDLHVNESLQRVARWDLQRRQVTESWFCCSTSDIAVGFAVVDVVRQLYQPLTPPLLALLPLSHDATTTKTTTTTMTTITTTRDTSVAHTFAKHASPHVSLGVSTICNLVAQAPCLHGKEKALAQRLCSGPGSWHVH